jgi:hypothetical protein
MTQSEEKKKKSGADESSAEQAETRVKYETVDLHL